jgi:hypothetical protein
MGTESVTTREFAGEAVMLMPTATEYAITAAAAMAAAKVLGAAAAREAAKMQDA